MQGYQIKTTADLQEAQKALPVGTIQTMLEHELEAQMEERGSADPE